MKVRHKPASTSHIRAHINEDAPFFNRLVDRFMDEWAADACLNFKKIYHEPYCASLLQDEEKKLSLLLEENTVETKLNLNNRNHCFAYLYACLKSNDISLINKKLMQEALEILKRYNAEQWLVAAVKDIEISLRLTALAIDLTRFNASVKDEKDREVKHSEENTLLRLLKKELENRKRYGKPVYVNWRNANLQFLNLPNADLSFIDLRDVDFRKANLPKACLEGAQLENIDMTFSNFEGADFRDVKLNRYDFSYSESNLSNTNFNGAELNETKWNNLKLNGASFHNAELRRANFERSDLRRCDFNGAFLYGVNFSGSNLKQAHFSNSTRLDHAALTKAKLDGVILGNPEQLIKQLFSKQFLGDPVLMQRHRLPFLLFCIPLPSKHGHYLKKTKNDLLDNPPTTSEEFWVFVQAMHQTLTERKSIRCLKKLNAFFSTFNKEIPSYHQKSNALARLG